MGWRYRKSKKLLPGVRLNINKNSTSITFGPKGLHYTISSTGRKTASVGIPGSGLSYSKTISPGDDRSRETETFPMRKFLKWTAIAGIVVALIIIVMRTVQAQTSAEIPPPPETPVVIELAPEEPEDFEPYSIQDFDSCVAYGPDGQELGAYYYTDTIDYTTLSEPQLCSLALDTFGSSGGFGLALVTGNGRGLYIQADCHTVILGYCNKAGRLTDVSKVLGVDSAGITVLDTGSVSADDIIFEIPGEALELETVETTSTTVYLTPTGAKYHKDPNCNGGTYAPTTLEDAVAKGLEPCGKCIH